MASRIVVEQIPLGSLRRYHHSTINTFDDQETLVDAVTNRPGFFGPSPVAFLSLIARRRSIKFGDLEEALSNDRTLVRANAFRASLFLLSAGDYPIYFRALYPILKSVAMEHLISSGVSEAMLQRFAQRVRENSFELPRSHEEIFSTLFSSNQRRYSREIERLIIRKLCDIGVLVRVSSKGWKGNQFSYAAAEDWLPEISLRPDNPESARTETVRRYLRAYGPATIDDICWWTGLPKNQIERSVAHLRREAMRFPVEGLKGDLIGLRENYECMRKNRPEDDGILLLPCWDPFLLGWRSRSRIVGKEWAKYVFDAWGNAASAIVQDGRVVGLWQFRDSQINILEFSVFEPYRSIRKAIFKVAESHAMLLAELSGAVAVNIIERRLPEPLTERPKGSFLWPLGKELPFKTSDKKLLESPMERRSSNTYRGKYLDSPNIVQPGQAEDSTN